jgi:hypothetical protein
MGLPLVNWEVLILLFSNYPDKGEEKKNLQKSKPFLWFYHPSLTQVRVSSLKSSEDDSKSYLSSSCFRDEIW